MDLLGHKNAYIIVCKPVSSTYVKMFGKEDGMKCGEEEDGNVVDRQLQLHYWLRT